MRVHRKFISFIRKPHFPFFLLDLVRTFSPSLARRLKYGRLNPNTREYWNERYSSGRYEQYEDERYGELRQRILELVRPGSRVLDVGCGTGKFMEMLRTQKDCDCTGVDISEVSIRIVQGKGFPGFRSSLPSLPPGLMDGFDGCTIIETLEHITDAGQALCTLSGTIRENGWIIIAVPNDCMGPEECDEHVASYTSAGLIQLVGRHFQVDTMLSVQSDGHGYLVVRAVKGARRKATTHRGPEDRS